MRIHISNGDILEFASWDEIFNLSCSKAIHCPDIPNQKFLDALRVIKSVAQKSFFTHPRFEHIISLLNQIKYYDVSRSGMHYGFVDDVFELSRFIHEATGIPGITKLFKAGIFTDFGVYSQFLVTLWLKQFYNILDVEVNNPPFNTDILVQFKNRSIHFHVKDIREQSREQRVGSAIITMDSVLTEKSRTKKRNKRLAITTFKGTPPADVDLRYWENVANNLTEKPQTKTLIFPHSNTSKNTQDVEITFSISWRDFSGIFASPLNSFTNTQLLKQKFNYLSDLVVKEKNTDAHVLVSITDDKYDWKSLRKSIKTDSVGLIVIEEFDSEISRSPLLLPSLPRVEKEINRKLPVDFDLKELVK